MFWWLVTVAILLLLLWQGYVKPYRYWKDMGVPQIQPWFLTGDLWPTILQRKNVIEWMNWIYWKHPESKCAGMYQFYTPVLCVRDPALIKQLTVKDFEYFTDHNSLHVSEEVDPLWNKNLVSLKGQRWKEMRSLLSGSFTSSKMRMVYGLIDDEAEKFVRYFLGQPHEGVQEVELREVFSRYTADVIASASFGIKVDSLADPDNEFYRMGREVSNMTGLLVGLKVIGLLVCPWLLKMLNIGFFPKRLSKFFTDIINETVQVREERGIVRPDMINLLLEVKRGAGAKEELEVPDDGFAVVKEAPAAESQSPKKHVEMTNEDIAAQALVFFLAGFDTVSSATSYACYELAVNPDVQEKLRREIQQSTNSKGRLSYEDLLGLNYLDMVVSESLRKWPVAPALDRLCVKPYTLQLNPTVTLKENDLLFIPVYNIQHDPKYYPDPEKFMPERFSEENKVNIQPYTYMPFGVGPRACIGSRFALLEIKAVLVHLLLHFEVVPTKDTKIPLEFNSRNITFTPAGGFPLGFKRL